MMAEDRDLRLKGYEVYRFGGAELIDAPGTQQLLNTFFDRLAERQERKAACPDVAVTVGAGVVAPIQDLRLLTRYRRLDQRRHRRRPRCPER